MSRKTILTAVVASLFLITLSMNNSFAKKNDTGTKGGGKKSEQSMGSMDHGDDHHAGIKSGRDFGQHVRGHNDHFSGTMNPGRHHQGYSGIKGDSERKK